LYNKIKELLAVENANAWVFETSKLTLNYTSVGKKSLING
jgi:hypothetical protein